MQMFDAARASIGAQGDPNAELAQKKQNINEFQGVPVKGTPERPAGATGVGTIKDKINTTARYGDRGREQRIDTSKMTPALGSFAKGTSHVPKTGIYKLHEGEAVIPKEKNPMHHMMEHLKSELGTPADKVPAKKLKHIVTRKAGEGHVHEHHYTHPDHHAPTEHATHGTDGMINHMMEHMSEPNPGEQEANDGQSGIPAGTPGMDAGTPGMDGGQ